MGAAAARRDRGRPGDCADAATELLTEATAVAGRTDYEVVFGPSNVVMQSADVAVVSEDYAAAAVARRMPRNSMLPLAARSRHLADVAHAELRLGRDQAAESALLTMEQSAGPRQVTRKLHGTLSGGEKSVVLHLPLFAALAAHYEVAADAPRLVLLDEVFVGIDPSNRGQLLNVPQGLCTYAGLDGIAIPQLLTDEVDKAVTTARFIWTGAVLEQPPSRTHPTPVTGGYAVRLGRVP